VTEHAIDQGSLGDCWLLAAMGALTEWPDRIKKIFNFQETYPDNGQLSVYLWTYGKQHRVQIDDRLPGKGYGSDFSLKYARKSVN